MRHLYSALLCIVVHPKHFIIRGGSLLNHHQCQDNGASALTTHQLQVERRESHRANQVFALTTHQLQVERRESHRANQVDALTTHQLQVERRECHRANQVDGDYWEAMIDKGQWWAFVQDTRVTLLLFYEKCHGIFNDHRESGPRFNISSERQYFLTV